jgi:Chaperone of endosialidase
MTITLDGSNGISTPAETFTGTGGVIAGDFTNATVANRNSFQTSTTNGSTGIYALPNGTSTAASWQASNAADPTNASKVLIATNGSTDCQLVSGRNGTGTYLPLTFYTNGSEQMRLDTSGNLGIGTTSPASLNPNSSYNVVTVTAKTDQATTVGSYYQSGVGQYGYINSSLISNTATPAPFLFQTGSTERMRIDSSGNLLVGTTSYGPYTTRLTLQYAGTTRWSVGPTSSTDTFYISSSSSSTGVYLTASGTSWTSNSDENLKNITGTIQNGLEKIATLRAAEFTWKADATNKPQVGLIAQDVQKVLPEVIDTNVDGHLGVRYTEVIPLLVAALQELSAEVTALKAKVGA